VPRCYEQIADQVPLGRRVRVGDQVRVVLRVPGRSRSTVAVTATVSGALPSLPTDDGYQTPYLAPTRVRKPVADAANAR
jgi:hypothetical protein